MGGRGEEKKDEEEQGQRKPAGFSRYAGHKRGLTWSRLPDFIPGYTHLVRVGPGSRDPAARTREAAALPIYIYKHTYIVHIYIHHKHI